MSLSPASQREIDLFRAFEQQAPELLRLACHVAFVPRVEPRLLRGIRLAFLPHLDALYEHQLWFSDLVHARNTSNFIFSPGMAGLLAQKVRDDPGPLDLDALWQQCQVLTRHWKPLDRLERDLYFFALNRNNEGLNQVYRDMLRLILAHADAGEAEPSKLLELARRIKYSTAILSDEQINAGAGRHLVNFAFDSLHDPGGWSDDVDPVRLPDWMQAAIPERQTDRLAVELRHDATKGKNILYFAKSGSGREAIEFDTPLPARLHIRAAGQMRSWVLVNHGSLFELDAETSRIEMTTRSGRHYRLQINLIPEPSPEKKQDRPSLYLAFSKTDRKRAMEVQQWLKTQDIDVDLIEEKPGLSTTAVTDPAIRVLRLWTEGMQRLWSERSREQQIDSLGSLLLQIDDIQAPSGFSSPGQLVDIRNWDQDSSHQLARELAVRISNWVKGVEGEDEIDHDLFDQLQKKLEDPHTSPEERLKIGDQLAGLGDPRPGVGLDESGLPAIDWVEIPAGEFIYGEKKQQRLNLDSFYIARYPITNAQYQTFIDDGGYEDDRWWSGLERQSPEKSRWKQANRPRETVSWYEAVAFCRWLSQQLGYEVRLPTEQEWEKAARSKDGREYPWGDGYRAGYANVDEKSMKAGPSNLKQTTAVGLYPQGASPYGVMDMAGNVLEWCLNKYDNPDDNAIDKTREFRVLRGGSWIGGPELARAARRGWSRPDYRIDYGGGFRVVCVSPIVR
jgi:formylglycine-generating enzyme required for sulfatase activity